MTKYTSYVFDKESGTYVKVSTTAPESGTSYDLIPDAPIKNATGSSPYGYVNVAGLEIGEYSIGGYFKLDGSSELLNTGSERIHMIITTDTETGKKVAIYETSENYEVITNIIIYDGSSIERILRQGPGSYWGQF